MDENRGKVPIWLRRLDLVGKQLREERPLPINVEERIDLALSLMAEGLACLYEGAGGENRRWRKAVSLARVRERMAVFSRLDADWIRGWRREHGRTFGG
ncbi:MAG: hypothetical protein ACE5JU_01675 [Candidatus Binatia bacterium]